MNLADLWESSPVRLTSDPADDWKLFLSGFRPDDVVWIGDQCATGKPQHAANFKTAAEWLAGPKPNWPKITPCTFEPGTFSRTAKFVRTRRFLPVQAVGMPQADFIDLTLDLAKRLQLVAVVDTGHNERLHSWFRCPPDQTVDELKVSLPKLGCDICFFTPTQCLDLPGAGKTCLQWFDSNPR